MLQSIMATTEWQLAGRGLSALVRAGIYEELVLTVSHNKKCIDHINNNTTHECLSHRDVIWPR